MNKKIIYLAKKKAEQSICRYKVSAIGFNKKGEIVSSSFNKPRYNKKCGGLHAEEIIMKKHPLSIKTIIICRIGKNGNFRPIDPCNKCKKLSEKLGIKIISIKY